MAAPVPLTFLSSLDTFADWEAHGALAQALEALAAQAEVWRFEAGDLVRFPDEAPPGPTWVTEGCLVVEDGQERRYVGVREAVTAPAGVWVKGQTAGRFLVIREASWRAWLQRWPAATQRLGETPPPPLPRSLLRSPLVLEPGETPVQIFRKSAWFLAMRLTVPAVFFCLFLTFGLVLQFGLDARAPLWALWLLPGVGMAVAGGLMALLAWEWSTSVLAVTDRSVIVRQIDVWTHRSDFEKLALERIREAVLSRRGLLQAVLGLVTLEVEGDSPKGRLLFAGLDRSSRFLQAMEEMRVRRVAAAPGRQAIREALAHRAGGAHAPVLERAPREQVPAARRRNLSWRVEREEGVWFRRHPWYVVRRTTAWSGLLALMMFVGALSIALWPAAWLPLVLVGAALALVPVGRIGWEVWDWSDDRLSVQGDRVVMVHRRPLWLAEVRQEGSLEQVQQVGVRKDSLAALILDFGTVSVSLGSSEPLVFEDASHPEWVQNEIFYRRTLWQQDKEQAAARARLDEVSEILDTWEQARRSGYFTEKKDHG